MSYTVGEKDVQALKQKHDNWCIRVVTKTNEGWHWGVYEYTEKGSGVEQTEDAAQAKVEKCYHEVLPKSTEAL